MKKLSKELQAKIEKVRRLAGQLQSKHFSWMVHAAARSFADAVERDEMAIVRYLTVEGPVLGQYSTSTKDRFTEALHEARDSLTQHREILLFLHALMDMLSEASAEHFAHEFWASYRQGRIG